MDPPLEAGSPRLIARITLIPARLTLSAISSRIRPARSTSTSEKILRLPGVRRGASSPRFSIQRKAQMGRPLRRETAPMP